MLEEQIKKFALACKGTDGELIETKSRVTCDYEDLRITINKKSGETKVYSGGELVRWGELSEIEYEPPHKLTEKELRNELVKNILSTHPGLLNQLEDIMESHKWRLGKKTASMEIKFKEIPPFHITFTDAIIEHTPYKFISPKFEEKWLKKQEEQQCISEGDKMEKAKTLEQIKFDEIDFIECMTVDKFSEKELVCRVHTIYGEDYQVEPRGLIFEEEKVLVKFK